MITILSKNPSFLINTSNICQESTSERIRTLSDSWPDIEDYQFCKLLVVHHTFLKDDFVHYVSKVPFETEILFVLPQISHSSLKIPSSYLSHHLLSEKELEDEFEVAWLAAKNGGNYKGSSFNRVFKFLRRLFNSPKSIGISEREIQVLNYMLRGESIHNIARELHITQSTVKKHLTTVKDKLGTETVKEIINCLSRFHWCDFQTGQLMYF